MSEASETQPSSPARHRARGWLTRRLGRRPVVIGAVVGVVIVASLSTATLGQRFWGQKSSLAATPETTPDATLSPDPTPTPDPTLTPSALPSSASPSAPGNCARQPGSSPT